jgi:hypothetical protein
MKIDDFLKEEMNWTDRDLEYRPVIGYWKVAELLQKWGEKQLLLHNVVVPNGTLCRCECEMPDIDGRQGLCGRCERPIIA